MEETLLDDIILRLTGAKVGRTTKQVQLTESEVRELCLSSKEIFLSQSNLLKLEAPVKICDDSQLVKQKTNFNKRGDKRSFKVPGKIKYNSFSMKVASSNFSQSSGGNNFFGLFGLKLDTHDITKLMDDPALNDLLDGTYKCSSLVKDKEEKAENINAGFFHSVRKAFSVLQLSRTVQSQNIADIDNFSNNKMSTCFSSSVSDDKGESSCTTDPSSCNKDSYSKPDTPSNPLDYPLCQPKDILKRLVLAEPKDLESLLLDVAKSSASSRNTSDLRTGKTMPCKVTLPPFPWSHIFSGHCRNNSDSIKLSTSRSTCQGRWLRIANVCSCQRIATDFLANIESLTYDQSLVPSGLSSENKIWPSISVSLPWSEKDSFSSAMCPKASYIFRDTGGQVNYQGNAGRCPKLVAAAQTLYDLATYSQKAMKARKLKSNEKLEETFATLIPVLASNNRVRSLDPLVSSKKPKLSMIESSGDPDFYNCPRRGPINWSTARSSRSSPSKSIKDLVAETKHSSASILKQSCSMPPPARVLNKAYNSHQKVRKILPMDWSRGPDGVD
ncbi:hypothetical protein F2P56_004764 [Juglans regia]|uniref:protein-serine/threonine phosphatase n=2 Tax=Juglans regia TaxID=51240 RepID=A0A6P9E8E5_JUGRE|nr:uncharacterized protein LOC109021586 [Juglans regia]KAF5478181.1 hypothetical protein F2P56_004764 [Juglans regia]